MTALVHRLEDFLAAADRADSADGIWQAALTAAGAIGFRRAIFLFYPDPDGIDPGASAYRTNFDRDWMRYWFEKRLDETELTFQATMADGRSATSFDVSRFLQRETGRDKRGSSQQAHGAGGAEPGFRKMYTHQLVSAGGALGGIAFSSDTLARAEFEDMSDADALYLSAVIHMTHALLRDRLADRERKPAIRLSARQRDVLKGLAAGKLYKNIAWELSLSENTVAYHAAQLRRKLGCSHNNEIVPTAYRLGLLHDL